MNHLECENSSKNATAEGFEQVMLCLKVISKELNSSDI